jgi:hypothetical protein
MKTSELTGLTLDYAVAIANGDSIIISQQNWPWYSTDWAEAGLIIEREGIEFWTYSANQDEHGNFTAIKTAKHPSSTQHYSGSTPLIAAMRCFVASKLGDEVEIPKELA